jgi:hypothetical protein
LEEKVAALVYKNREYSRRGSVTLTTWHHLSEKVGIKLADKRRQLTQTMKFSFFPLINSAPLFIDDFLQFRWLVD